MRIATITNWAYGITVGLTLASGSAMLMASSADRVERRGGTAAPVFDTLSDEVENDAWALSDLARLYVIKPSPETLTQYQQLQQTDKSIEQRLGGLKDNGASREELALLQDGLRIADELQDEQQAALAHVARGDAPAAIAVLYGTAYETELERMQTQIDRFRQMLEHRAAVAIDRGHRALADLAYAVGNHGRPDRPDVFVRPRLHSQTPGALPGGSPERRGPASRLPRIMRWRRRTLPGVDEIGDMAQAIRIFRENGLGPSAAGAAARRRLGDPRAAGAYDSAAAGL